MKFIEKRGDEFLFEAMSRELGAMMYALSMSAGRHWRKVSAESEPWPLYDKKIIPLSNLYSDKNVSFPLLLTEDELLQLNMLIVLQCFLQVPDDPHTITGTKEEDIIAMTDEFIKVLTQFLPEHPQTEEEIKKKEKFLKTVAERAEGLRD